MEGAWLNHSRNLMLMKPYTFFDRGRWRLMHDMPNASMNFTSSTSPSMMDEGEHDGPLALILEVLREIHCRYFESDPRVGGTDIRTLLHELRTKVLQDCVILFPAAKTREMEMARELGASCTSILYLSVTHVVSEDLTLSESQWALQKNMFLVHPEWVVSSYRLFRRQSEEQYSLVRAP
ncbi:hypothetical protein CRG98_018999 [Punica granatum]|nr:hypothetical protein CRG98_018999 [Punica granatum]